MHNENEFCINFESFKWTSAKGAILVIRMNYFNKEDHRLEALKGSSVKDIVEYEHELESAKEILTNVEINQRKLFVGIEQGTGKM